jgi:hypothetical protein
MFQNLPRAVQSGPDSSGSKPTVSLPNKLAIVGVPVILLAVALTSRIVWEETALTMQQGPQMIGFSLAHGSGAVLLFAPILLVLWLLIALVTAIVSLVRKRRLSRWFWSTGAIAVLVLGALSLPPVFWQWLFLGSFARSSHAADLMTYAAGEGDVHTVNGYLSHGVPVESVDYQGSTALFNAARAGSASLVQSLISKGANVNALNLYGDSPLDAAIQNHHDSVAVTLKAHGAIQVHGSPEQRDAASKAIVRKDIERMAKMR